MAVSSVRIFLEGCGGEVDSDEGVASIHNRKYIDLFAKLETKFSSDPEHSSIRLVHVKFAFSNSQLVTGCEKKPSIDEDRYEVIFSDFEGRGKVHRHSLIIIILFSRHAAELCLAIIRDHAERKHELSDNQVLELLLLLQERYAVVMHATPYLLHFDSFFPWFYFPS